MILSPIGMEPVFSMVPDFRHARLHIVTVNTWELLHCSLFTLNHLPLPCSHPFYLSFYFKIKMFLHDTTIWICKWFIPKFESTCLKCILSFYICFENIVDKKHKCFWYYVLSSPAKKIEILRNNFLKKWNRMPSWTLGGK